MKPITVNVIVFNAKGLKSKTGKHKFCVQAKIGSNRQKTNVVEDLFGNPSFNKVFIFCTDSLKNELKIKVTEKNDKDVLGQVVVQLRDLNQEKNNNPDRVPLRVHKNCPMPSGELLFDAWVSGFTTLNLDQGKHSASNESLKSLSGFKKLKEKLHASALRLNSYKEDKSEIKKSHLSIFSGKNRGLFRSKNKTSMSCQDLSGSVRVFQPFQGDTILECYKSSNEDISDLGNEVNSRKSSENSMKDFVPAPEITGVSPNLADCKGGTVVTIRGLNLGRNAEDIIHIYICGIDMISTVKYVSPQKLFCTTLPCISSKGNVVVVTWSGGLGTSPMNFTFYELVESRSLNDSLVSENSDKVFSDNAESSPVLNKSHDINSYAPSPPPRFNRRANNELGAIKESSQDVPSEPLASKILQEGSKPYHKKNLSLSRSSIFLSINQSPPNSSKRLSLFNSDNDDLHGTGYDLLDHPGNGKGNSGMAEIGIFEISASALVDDSNTLCERDGIGKSPLSFEKHDLSTPEGIKLFYSSSDVGLVQRLCEYNMNPVKNVDDKLKMAQEELQLSNKHLSNVIFSIGEDASSDDESIKKTKIFPLLSNQSKPPFGDPINDSKDGSDTELFNNPGITHKHDDFLENVATQVSGKQVVQLQPISKQDLSESEDILNHNDCIIDQSLSAKDPTTKLSNKHFCDAPDLNDDNSKLPATSITYFNVPAKPPRIREFVELCSPDPSLSRSLFMSEVSENVSATRIIEPIKNDSDYSGDDGERVKRLEEEVFAKEISLQELRHQNRTLQEERNLLRRYIEVLISRALSICPEILCTDGGHISLG